MSKVTKSKKPWPTKKAMAQVYAMHLWGKNGTPFYSGEGSHDPKIVIPYINAVSSFLNALETPIALCDLGCGDFNIGKQLAPHCKAYIGVDIVEDLIQYNKEQFTQKNTTFHCLDIAKEGLPPADCVIIRQVLQHLSNAEIESIVTKLSAYKYVILTEHLPVDAFEPNKDIISGQGIRLKKQSGVVLTAAPFNLDFKNKKELLSVPVSKGVIVTTLFEMK